MKSASRSRSSHSAGLSPALLKRLAKQLDTAIAQQIVHERKFGTPQEIIAAQFGFVIQSRPFWSLADLQEARKKLGDKDGGYGICEDCKVPIPEKRLLAKAEAKFCIPCQKRADRKQRLARQAAYGNNGGSRLAEQALAQMLEVEEEVGV